MKINLSTVLKDFEGNEVVDAGKPMTVGRACLLALSSGANEDKSPQTAVSLYELGIRLVGKEEAEITPEEASLLKTIVAKAMVSPLYSGQVCKALNG